MKTAKWIVAFAAACAIGLVMGCSDSSDDSDEPTPVAVKSVTLSETTLALLPGETEKLTATVKPDDASNKKVDWSSSDEKIATVSDNGTVTAVALGTADITVTTVDGGFTATCQVTVSDMTITLNTTSLALAPRDTARLEATVLPASASGREVAWSSSDPNVATVDGGVVMAGDLGTATITAQVGSMTATCEVTVKELSEIFVMDGNTLTKYTGSATTVVIPDSVTNIDGAAFYGNTTLEHVTIPGSVESIGNSNDDYGVFEECSNLKSVTIGDGVKSIGYYAFNGCSGLTEVKYDGTLADWCGISWSNSAANPLCNGNAGLYIGGAAVTDAEISEGVTEIKAYAFYGYRRLTSVRIPASVTSIGYYAFDGCEGLTSVKYSGSKKQWNDIEKGDNWDLNTGEYTIDCTDGKLDKNGNVIEE